MRRLIALSAVLLISCLFVIMAFSLEIKPSANLLRPPTYSDKGASVQLSLERELETSVVLKTVSQGREKKAVFYGDFDGSGLEQAAVFYVVSSEPDSVIMSFMKKQDGNWSLVCSHASSFSDILRVRVANVSGDEKQEIAVCYSISDSIETQRLYVYSLDSNGQGFNAIRTVFSTRYAAYELADADFDGDSELFVVEPLRSLASAGYYLTLVDFKNNVAREVCSQPVDSAMAFVTAVCHDSDKKGGEVRVYIDGSSRGGQTITDVLVYSGQAAEMRRQYINGRSMAFLSARSKNALCADIDLDGRVEVPFEVRFHTGDDEVGLLSFVRYSKVNSSKLSHTAYYLDNAENGYYFRLPEELVGSCCAEQLSAKSIVRFYSLTHGSRGRLLFELRVKDKDDTERLPAVYKSLGSYGEGNVYVRIYQAGENLNLSAPMLREHLTERLEGSGAR